MSALLPAVVLLPVLGAVVCVLLPRPHQVIPGVVATVLTAGLQAWMVVAVAVGGPLQIHLAGWAPPLGIALRADGLSAAFVAMTAVVTAAISFFAASDPATTGARTGFWPLSLLMSAGLSGVFLTADLFNAYVAIEILGLAAVGLVALGDRTAASAAFRYLLVAVVGSMALLLAIGLVYAATGTLDMGLVADRIAPEQALLPLALATVGLGLKTALFPLHAWLPDAHATAPPAVSPLLSALVVKGSFFLTLRLWADVLPATASLAAAVAVLGGLGVLWGGVQAWRQSHLKRVVAYSTVAQVGYLYLPLPLLVATPAGGEGAPTPYLLGAITAMAWGHAAAKAAMFAAAGSLLLGTGTDRIDGLVGAAHTERILTGAIMLATVSLVGLPVSLGFTGKWGYLVEAIEMDNWAVVAVLLAGSLLTAGYLLRPVAALLRDSDESQEVGRVTPEVRPGAQRWVPLALGVVAVAGGFLGSVLVDLTLVGRI